MRGARRRLAAAVVAAGLLAGCSPPLPPATLAEQLLLVVSPHPDDELQGWSLVTGRGPGTYPVFVTLTHGESTTKCAPEELERTLRTGWGEREPEPLPEGPGTPSCAEARLDSWHAFLDEATAVEGWRETLDDLVEGEVQVPGVAAPATTWVGESGARVAVDGGDGSLTPQVVDAAVDAVLGLRGTVLPDLPLATVVGAAYTNDSPGAGRNRAADGTCTDHPCEGDPRYAEYEHPDHWAVREALLAREPQAWTCVTTWPRDPELTQRRDVPPDVYEALMGLGGEVEPGDPESRERLGAHQRAYGWLAFPRTYWTPTVLPVPDEAGEPLVMSSRQSFTCRRPA
ncbi:hypothetical protein [Kineococcus terrestris]|uniref:hypothetical protein n=1 Tax=Kineococcus terrestris TaxID=2044856 RepID=UPI0034DB6051